MVAPLLLADDIKPALEKLLEAERSHFLFAFYGRSDTHSVTTSGYGDFPVISVGGELALRRTLLGLRGADARAVILLPTRDPLPADLRGRFVRGGEVQNISKEARIKRLLGGVPGVDAALLRHPLVDHLLAASPSLSLVVGAGEVNERTLWEAWLARMWGLDTEGGLAVDTLLASVAANGRGGQFAAALAQLPALQIRLESFLEATLKAAGPVLLHAFMRGLGERVLELSVVCEALKDQTSARLWLRLKLKQTLDLANEVELDGLITQLAEAANLALAAFARNPSGDAKAALRALYERAEGLVDDGDVRRVLIESSRLPSGFRLRLEALGQALSQAAAERSRATLLAALAAKDKLFAHTSVVDDTREREARRSEMAVRLLLWVAEADGELEPGLSETADADVARLGRWYVEQGGFVDWARQVARGAVHGAFDRGVADVLALADARRDQLDARFARALVAWVGNYRPSKQVMPIEQVLARVAAPFLEERAERKLLVILLDGMAWAQASELIHSLGEQADVWGPAAFHARGRQLKLGDARTPVVIAGLPTITEVSRTAFFAGKPMASGKEHDTSKDPDRLRDNAALKKFCNGPLEPRLYLRAEGHEVSGNASQAAISAVLDPDQRLVSVVINAIDSSLKGDIQQWHPWRVDNVLSLPDLLSAAKRAGRSVLLASDHGHVRADRFEPGTKPPISGGARWRPLTKETDVLQPYEVKLSGEGVCLPKGAVAVALIADEQHRYGGAPHAGEHGGATLAEVVAPCVLIHWDDPLGAKIDADCDAQSQYKPAWWRFELAPSASAGGPGSSAPTAKPIEKAASSKTKVSERQLGFSEIAPEAKPAAAAPKPLSKVAQALAELPTIVALGATQRAQVLASVEYLLERDGIAQIASLAAHIGVPEWNAPGFIARFLQRGLNVDGFQVVTYDQAQVRLEREMLIQQFGVKL